MCNPALLLAVAAVASTAGTVVSTVSAVGQARYEEKLAKANQKAENAKIADAFDRGNRELEAKAREQHQVQAAQRAAIAANGIDMSFGTASDFLADQVVQHGDERFAIAENTRREVMGYDINAANFGAQAAAAKSKAKGALIGGIFGTIGTAAGGAAQAMKAGK